MTVGTEYTNWQIHKPAPDSRYSYCSPNIIQIYDEMAKRWGCTDIGCYGWRPIRAGTAPSTHGFGAARDIRYDHVGRVVALNEIIPWLINFSDELHVSAIHDYIGCRIWHAGRGWKAQTANPANGMGQSWATYFHIETTITGWNDNTPVPNRGVSPTPPEPIPGGFMPGTIQLGSQGSDVYIAQMFCRKWAGNTTVVVDAKCGPITVEAMKQVQAWYGLIPDGVWGPVTWGKINQVVNV